MCRAVAKAGLSEPTLYEKFEWFWAKFLEARLSGLENRSKFAI